MANILVIDDNKHIVQLLKDVLSSETHHVDTVGDGLKALEMIDCNDYDISLIDVELPDINGLSVLQSLREKSPRTIPIVVSGVNKLETVVESVQSGAYEYLYKPFDIDELIRVVNEALEERTRIIDAENLKREGKEKISDGVNTDLIRFISNAIILSAALLAGFIFQQILFEWQRLPLFLNYKEIVYLLLSFTCSYCFISLKDQQQSDSINESKLYPAELKQLTFSYILFAGILFFIASTYEIRLALIFGYVLGIGGLSLNKFILIPQLEQILASSGEGPKSLILKNLTRKNRLVSRNFEPELKLSKKSDLNSVKNLRPRFHSNSIKNNQRSSLVEDYLGKRNMVKLSRKKKTEKTT